MGQRTIVVMLVGLLTAGLPIVMPATDTADAQGNQCSCFASFDAVDSDLRFIERYYNSVSIDLPADACPAACDAWRRQWFYWDACDFPVRINRGRNAWWGYDNGLFGMHEGPDTWWCPFPPP
jgi:hypothetical protein